MPTYDYQCRTCGVITEVVHSMLEDGPAACDSCGGELRRLVSPSGIIFKGSGFYKTDSRSSSSGSATGGTQPSSTAGDGAAAPASADGGSKAGKTTPTTPSGGGAGSGESGRSSGSGAAASD